MIGSKEADVADRPQRHLFEEMIFIVDGRGATS